MPVTESTGADVADTENADATDKPEGVEDEAAEEDPFSAGGSAGPKRKKKRGKGGNKAE